MRRAIIFLIIALVLFSYGCAMMPGKRPGLVPEKIEYHKGTEGLVVNVIKDMPPKEVWKHSEFVVGLELQNRGAHDISRGWVALSGFNPEYIDPPEDFAEFELDGKSPANPTGDYEILQFRFSNVNFPEGKEYIEETYKIVAGYDYETVATAMMCIDPDIFGLTKSVCRVGEVGLKGGQGAPVAVTRVDEGISPLDGEIEVKFTIYFENEGDGKIYQNRIFYEAVLGKQKKALDCGGNEMILKKGSSEHKIKCSAKIEKTLGAYITPLIIRLRYVYVYEDYKKIKIVD